ncbi:MAG: PD-(D/E)XK nuclease family protein [Solirubrobacteraceae bacterium MAG38_C4-C5]|nr:PD-(D/E)XK nuclease family protein [Candidatus Siliceabacter maunaloa]
MPLRLVTGPANAEKARAVLGGVRDARSRGALLVVPTAADVERFRAELVEGGVVFGVGVLTFRGLLEEVAARTGLRTPLLGPVARERVARRVAAATPLAALASSASTPGFAAALCDLCAELEAARVTPQRFARALADWSAATGRDSAYGRELAALYAAWRRALERLGRTDREVRDAAALDALVATPAAWGATPVFVYGFDDLTPQQCDALVALGRVTEVCASLPYEAGRAAFAGRATTFAILAPEAAEVTRLEARAEHYAPGARAALHHLERGMFEPAAPAPAAAPGDAVALLEGGGERAELELVAAEVRARLDDGVPGDQIAVVCRSPDRVAPLLGRVFGALGIPVACERRVGLERTALGRGLLGLLRSALADGPADDLLAWLRTPGRVASPWATDRLERRIRQEHLHTATAAREAWEADGGATLWELDRLRGAAQRDSARASTVRAERGTPAADDALLTEVAARATALLAADRRGDAPLLTEPEVADARALAAVRGALEELAALARINRSLAPGAADIVSALEGLEVDVAPPAAPGAVVVSDPLAVRARRVRVLVAFGLQEGVFPPAPRPEPFLADEARRELAQHIGLVLPRRGDEALGAERYLFYALASRPEERLVLAWHTGSDDGDPAVRSFFVDDVCDLFDTSLEAGTRRRALGAAAWPRGGEPTAREVARSAAARGPRLRPRSLGPLEDPAVLAAVRGREGWSSTALETLAGCGVRWFVERWLRPATTQADPEAMMRGSLAHRLLEEVMREIQSRPPRVLGPEDLTVARAALARALAQHADAYPFAADAQRLRTLLRRLEADLDRVLAHTVQAGSVFAPTHLEVGFGREGDALDALDLGDGLRVYGQIDRVDVDSAGRALVYDYKGTRPTPGTRWLELHALQVTLYLRAAQQLLGLVPVGGLYQAYRDKEVRARGAVVRGADPDLRTVNGDVVDEETFRALLDDVVAVARRGVDEVRRGTLAARPATCAFKGGCAHPSICRTDAA